MNYDRIASGIHRSYRGNRLVIERSVAVRSSRGISHSHKRRLDIDPRRRIPWDTWLTSSRISHRDPRSRESPSRRSERGQLSEGNCYIVALFLSNGKDVAAATETVEAEGKPARFLAAMIGSGRQYLLNRCGVSRRDTF